MLSARPLYRINCILIVTTLIVVTAPSVQLNAQEKATTLSLAIPSGLKAIFSDSVIRDFQSTYPNIRVNLLNATDSNIAPFSDVLSAHLDDVQNYVQTADVVFINRDILSPYATSAGYFLDLTPFIQGDKTLNSDDFYPALWKSFQWDNGIWALPYAADITALTYVPSAFNKVGLAYPDGSWTLDDLTSTIRKLTLKDATGNVVVPGFSIQQDTTSLTLFRSLLGENLYDSSVVPNTPQIDKASSEKFLTTWHELEQEGTIALSPSNDLDKSMMRVGRLSEGSQYKNSQQKWQWALLPGNRVGLETRGFAVSGGTQYAQQAYTLAQYLTRRLDIVVGYLPARQSLQQSQQPPEIQKLLDQSLDKAIPDSELRYTDYLYNALDQLKTSSNVKEVLQSIQAQTIQDSQAAIKRRSNTKALIVATPFPTVRPQLEKVTLKFGVESTLGGLSHDRLDALIKDFTASDPQVVQINRSEFGTGDTSIATVSSQYDCFTLSENVVPDIVLKSLINLDPLMEADSSFSKADVLGNIMPQVERDNKIWAMPMYIEPLMLSYNTQMFDSAGLKPPNNDWAINEFVDDLKTLKTQTGNIPYNPGADFNYLLPLIAAYGGLPVDYRANPPIIDFTNPATVEAIQQALDLVKQGYIKYSKLSTFNPPGGSGSSAIANEPGFGMLVRFISGSKVAVKSIPYPKGDKYAGISIRLGTGYISANSPNPEACYRWLTTLRKHPDVLVGMPVYYSVIADSAFQKAQSPDLNAYYASLSLLMKSPDTIAFPALQSLDTGDYLLEHWLLEAFDNVVLNNADLATELTHAQLFTENYLSCVEKLTLPELSTQDDAQAYYLQLEGCAIKVDPKMKSFFGNN